MIVRKDYTIPAGGSRIIRDGALTFVRILRVTREGMGYNRTNSLSVGNREFYSGVWYVGIRPQLGNLVFENDFPEGGKVTVIYEFI